MFVILCTDSLNGSAHNFIQYYLVQLEIKWCGGGVSLFQLPKFSLFKINKGGVSSDFQTCFNYLNLAYLK